MCNVGTFPEIFSTRCLMSERRQGRIASNLSAVLSRSKLRAAVLKNPRLRDISAQDLSAEKCFRMYADLLFILLRW